MSFKTLTNKKLGFFATGLAGRMKGFVKSCIVIDVSAKISEVLPSVQLST